MSRTIEVNTVMDKTHQVQGNNLEASTAVASSTGSLTGEFREPFVRAPGLPLTAARAIYTKSIAAVALGASIDRGEPPAPAARAPAGPRALPSSRPA